MSEVRRIIIGLNLLPPAKRLYKAALTVISSLSSQSKILFSSGNIHASVFSDSVPISSLAILNSGLADIKRISCPVSLVDGFYPGGYFIELVLAN